MRLYLQLTAMSSKISAIHIRLPEGLSEETHPGLSSYWDKFLEEKGKLDKDLPLVQQVSEYVILEVLKSEHLQRIVTQECNRFNRLVVKLEACVDNPDFWKETEQPS